VLLPCHVFQYFANSLRYHSRIGTRWFRLCTEAPRFPFVASTDERADGFSKNEHRRESEHKGDEGPGRDSLQDRLHRRLRVEHLDARRTLGACGSRTAAAPNRLGSTERLPQSKASVRNPHHRARLAAGATLGTLRRYPIVRIGTGAILL
jgi:hypothetical protein